jgi:ATP-binding cassette, subfamily G (WHITE), member 2, SNQ2
LAQRKNIGVVKGDILVDGRPLNSDFARGTAYGMMAFGYLIHLSYILFILAEQMDVHEGEFRFWLSCLRGADYI